MQSSAKITYESRSEMIDSSKFAWFLKQRERIAPKSEI